MNFVPYLTSDHAWNGNHACRSFRTVRTFTCHCMRHQTHNPSGSSTLSSVANQRTTCRMTIDSRYGVAFEVPDAEAEDSESSDHRCLVCTPPNPPDHECGTTGSWKLASLRTGTTPGKVTSTLNQRRSPLVPDFPVSFVFPASSQIRLHEVPSERILYNVKSAIISGPSCCCCQAQECAERRRGFRLRVGF